MSKRTYLPPRSRATSLALFLILLCANVAHAQRYLVIDVPRQMKVGATESIVYHSQGYGGTLRFEYSTDDAVWKPIDTVTARDGTNQRLAWIVPDDTASSAYIRVVSDDSVRASSSTFAIVTLYRPVLEIAVNTSMGQVLYSGTKLTIRWSLFYAEDFTGRVVAELSLDGGATWRPIDSLVSRTPFDSLTWIVPDDTTSRGMIRIRTDDWSSISTTSATLKIRPEPSLRLLRPNGGETLSIESEAFVVWEAQTINGHYTVEYTIDGGTTWLTIANRHNAIEGLDSVLWLVPSPPSPEVLIRIVHEEGTLADTSDGALRIIDPTSDAPVEDRQLPLQMDLTDAGIVGRARER